MSIKTSTSESLVLQADNILLDYLQNDGSRKQILTDFSMQVRAGEILAVLGPSGVGKSSRLRVLAGLKQPSCGQIRVHNKLVTSPHPRLAFMFQDPCLLPWLNLEANVAFGLDFRSQPKLDRSERRQRVQDAIAEVRLSEAHRAFPRELSGGMAQRVALARSLARRPEILLLDEPFSALDEVIRSEMQQLLLEVCHRHHTAVVMITHDIDEALLLADRVLLLGGTPGKLLREWQPQQPRPRNPASEAMALMRLEILQTLQGALAPEPDMQSWMPTI